MSRSSAHGRLFRCLSGSRAACADLSRPRSARDAGRCGVVALGTLLAALWTPGLFVVAQTAAPGRVRAEFRTAPRPLVTQAIDRGRVVRTAGAVSRAVTTAQDLGPRDGAASMEHIQLVLQRTQERQAAFDAQVEALHQRGNPNYQKWLTPETVGAEFGPAASDLATLTGYLLAEGFTVNGVGKAGMFVDFSGTVAQVQRSFHTEIHDVRMPDGGLRYSAMSDAQIPEALAGLVAGFVSLSDIPAAHPNLRKAVAPVSPIGASPGLGVSPLDTVSSTNYAVGPQDFYTIYNEAPLLSAPTPINGSGVTIALLEESAITPSDVTFFRNMFGVTPATPVSLVTDTGYGGNTCTAPAKLLAGGEEGEAILDIEWAGSVAPGANLLFMQCATSGPTLGVLLSAEAVVNNNLADIISLSYGEYEGYYPTQDTMFNNLWEQAASQGQTVVVSAGDTGAATEDGNYGDTYAIYGITTSSFSTTAWNVSAGGTDFQDYYNQLEGDPTYSINTFWNSTNTPGLGSAKSYVPEMTWNDTCASSIYNSYIEGMSADGATLCGATARTSLYMVAGGGSPSTLHARPSWQTGTVFGLPTLAAYPTRLQPDVSLFAANGLWHHDLPSYQSDAPTPLSYAGGTSFVAPQLAGVFALIQQKTGARLGQPNYILYSMAGKELGINSFTGSGCNGSGASGVGTTNSLPAANCVFYDIQTGNTSVDCQGGKPNCYVLTGKTYGVLSTSSSQELPAFPTNAGWDQATGIGSINIANLVNNWQNAGAGGVLYTPTVAVTATSASYTYGLPSAITYTATVSGAGSYPTGTVTFSGSPTISTIGNAALTGSAGCSSGSTCAESASQSYTPPGNLAVGSYTITGSYLSTNENYATGSGTTSLSVTAQKPTVNVSASSVAVGAVAAASLSANIVYAGTGIAPSGGLRFQVDAGATVTATCVGSSSPVMCSFSGYDTSALAIGSHTITATTIADGNYSSATGSNTLTVMPLPTIVFTVPNHHTQDSSFNVSASSNSLGTLTYSVVSGPATILGNAVTLTGIAGTVTLKASQAASGSYAAGSQTASFLVIAGSVWLGNSTGSLSTFDLTGGPITNTSGYTGGGVGTIASPLGLAFDAAGNAWVANSNGVSEFSRKGIAVSPTPFTGGGINKPLAIAVDGLGQIWVANTGGMVSVLNNTGSAVSPSTGYSGAGSKPGGIAIDISGSVWIPSYTANTVTRILGAAAPVVPLATAAASGAGVQP